jgi:hypothetical protein
MSAAQCGLKILNQMLKSSLDPIIDARFLELFDMYYTADEQEVQEKEAYHEYRLLLINNEKYQDYVMTHEMNSEGFQLTECKWIS